MVTVIIALIAALLPVGLLAFYICRKDKERPEPVSWLLKAGAYGVGAVILVMIVGLLHPSFLTAFPSLDGTVIGAIGEALFDAAIPEEAAKLLMLWLVLRKNPYFDEHLDGIVYATCVGLGFAGLENIMYIATNLDSLASIALTRALFSVPGHFFFAVVMGYYVSLAYFDGYSKKRKTGYWILAFVIPVVLHCIYDAILMSAEAIPELLDMLALVFIGFCIWLRKHGIKRIAAMKAKDIRGKGGSFARASTIKSTVITPDYHSVFIDNGNTAYLYHNGELSLYRVDDLENPFVKYHVDSFKSFISTIKNAVDGEETIFIYHNNAAPDLNHLLGCDPYQAFPDMKFIISTYSENGDKDSGFIETTINARTKKPSSAT